MGRGFLGEMTQRFVAMLGCGSCHVRGCRESCSLRFASSDPQPVIVRHRPNCSHATTANADRLIAGCLITSAAPLRFLLSISKYLPYRPHPEEGPRHRNDLSLRKPVAWSSNPAGGTARETIPAAGARSSRKQFFLPGFLRRNFFPMKPGRSCDRTATGRFVRGRRKLRPLHPQKRTNSARLRMSALCQKRTHALQQNYRYSITSSAMASGGRATVRLSHN